MLFQNSEKKVSLERKRIIFEEFVLQGKLKKFRKLRMNVAIQLREDLRKLKRDELTTWISYFKSQVRFNDYLGYKLLNILAFSSSDKNINLGVPLIWKDYFDQIYESDYTFKFSKFARINWNLRRCAYSFKRFCRILKLILFMQFKDFHKREEEEIFVVDHLIEKVTQSELLGKEEYNLFNWLKKNQMQVSKVNFCSETECLLALARTKMGFAKATILVARVVYHCLNNWALALIKKKPFIPLDQALNLVLYRDFCAKNNNIILAWTESSGSVRPIWSYLAEASGVKCIFINFSNSGSLIVDGKQDSIEAHTLLYSWSSYLTCTRFQENTLSESVLSTQRDVSFNLLGIPWLKDSKANYKFNERGYVAVFGYEAPKKHFGFSTINDLGLATEESFFFFLEPILRICDELEIQVLYKRKKSVSDDYYSRWQQTLLKELSTFESLTCINPEVSPSRIIDFSQGVISMPPTSTGILARQANRRSIYFDPIGLVKKNDPCLDQVEVINQEKHLAAWLANLRTEKKWC